MKADQNSLYPVFLKPENLNFLIVGAGEVGHEKLSFIAKSSPQANITVIATWVSSEVARTIQLFENWVKIIQRPFEPEDVKDFDIVIAATNDRKVNHEVYSAAKLHRKIVNVADTPHLCDFYMGSIVTRGDLKVAISTNGKSPTFAKRFRQLLEAILPIETSDLLIQLKLIRDRLGGDFAFKVRELNRLTQSLLEERKVEITTSQKS